MQKFFSDAPIWNFGQNLLMLSLDALRPELEKLKAPRLVETDYLALRKWTALWPSFEYFPYTDGIDFAVTLRKLSEMLPQGHATEIFDWALRSSPLTDPSLDQRYDSPARAADEWSDSLAKAHDLNRISATDLSPEGEAALLKMLKAFNDRMTVADTLYRAFEKEWDPYPREPTQFAYNLKCKSPWDRHIYETYCQSMSFHLNFSVVSLIKHQETHRFVRAFATLLPPADHEKVALLLLLVLEGQGHYALHPWQLDRLREYADMPPETLVPFTREPV